MQMLYDNGQLAQTYLDAYRVTGNPRYARVARGILDYLHRDMTHPDGGFYSAEVHRSIIFLCVAVMHCMHAVVSSVLARNVCIGQCSPVDIV